MSRSTILVSAPLGLGAVALLWAALAARAEPEAKGPRPSLKAPAGRKLDPAPEGFAPAAALPVPAAARTIAPAAGEDGNARIQERIRKMEDRLLELELRRNDLAGTNQDLERRIKEKSAELWAGQMAEWRVRGLESLLGLTAAQKQALTELWTKWMKEDAGRPAPREAWLDREVDLRSRLSVEQAAKLHDNASAQSQQMWANMGASIGGMIGASRDDQTRFQQMLGDYRPPNSMLLPEGYGADWQGLMKDASGRLRPVLPADQTAKLDKVLPR
jgi:hypothetical protein